MWKEYQKFENPVSTTIYGPGRFPGIAGNAGNHGNNRKFH